MNNDSDNNQDQDPTNLVTVSDKKVRKTLGKFGDALKELHSHGFEYVHVDVRNIGMITEEEDNIFVRVTLSTVQNPKDIRYRSVDFAFDCTGNYEEHHASDEPEYGPWVYDDDVDLRQDNETIVLRF